MKVIYDKDNQNVPIKMWCDSVEDNCMEQALHLAKLPFAYKHIALMPDAHSGYGMPIGAVLATRDVIIPNAVGKDIGCGVYSVKTDWTDISTEKLKEIMGKIRKTVPVGFAHQKTPQWGETLDTGKTASDMFYDGLRLPDHGESYIEQVLEPAEDISLQWGTLGGGNHFIEIEKGSDSHIWVTLHSGSRNVGAKVAKFYDDEAVGLNELWYSSVPKEWQLAFLPIHTQVGRHYIQEMGACMRFARVNRHLIMRCVLEAFGDVSVENSVHITHNYADLENYDGDNFIIHRKGAVWIKKGSYGVIPGSMGTSTYIVRGTGNTESFLSASHGAGRTMSRKQANKEITEEMAQEAMKGVAYGRFNGRYDECPQAYKDIDKVIADESDLVEPLVKLTPLGVIKG